MNGSDDLRAALANEAALTAECVPEFVERILAAAASSGASDLHLEPRAERLVFKLRRNGCLGEIGQMGGALRANVIQRVKVLAGLMTYRSDIPQEGRIKAASGELRVSVYPALFGERAVIRLAAPEMRSVSRGGGEGLDELGMDPTVLEKFKELLARPQGLLLLTGPAGSGKTTTLYASLAWQVARWRGERHIVSIEDPVERCVEGVTQTQVNPAAELDFAAALRALLRQDPEILMLGEIRDTETAQAAVQAALTGHLLLSTIHASSTPEVLLRLAQLGVEPGLVASVVSGVLAQRLLRLLCPSCRVATSDANEPFHASERGCERCAGSGYSGRGLLAELLVPNEAIREALRQHAGAQKLIVLAAEAGCAGLWPRGIKEVAAGRATLDDLRRVLAEA